MGIPGATEWLLIFAVIVLLFGANKLPKLGGAIGEGIKNFKKGIKSDEDDDDDKAAGKGSPKELADKGDRQS